MDNPGKIDKQIFSTDIFDFMALMITVTSTEALKSPALVERVGQDETVRMPKHGRLRARLVPDCDFMSSQEMVRLFAGYQADAWDNTAADAVAASIQCLVQAADEALHH